MALGNTSVPPAQCDSSFLNLLIFGSSHLFTFAFFLPTDFGTSPMHYIPFETTGAVCFPDSTLTVLGSRHGIRGTISQIWKPGVGDLTRLGHSNDLITQGK